MVKRNTIEVDDAVDLVDDHLVNEELEIFERESQVPTYFKLIIVH